MDRQKGNPYRVKDKKIQILIAATELIRDHGIQAISFERIARQAGLSRQLLRYYFTEPDQLMVELCDFLASRYRDLLMAGILEVGRVERLAFFLDFFFDLAEGQPMPDDLEVYDSLLAYAVGSDPMKERLWGWMPDGSFGPAPAPASSTEWQICAS